MGSLGEGVSASFLLSDRTSSPVEYRELYVHALPALPALSASAPNWQPSCRYYEKLVLMPAPYLPNDYNATVQTPRWVHASTLPGEGGSRVELCAHHHVWKIDR